MTSPTPPTPIGTVASVNVGLPRTVQWAGREVLTGIWKAPVDGRIPAIGHNLTGDGQADLRVHGGPDKAIYAYALEDYRWWAAQLGTELGPDLGPGTFGENLTTTGIDLAAAVIGEVWTVGTTRLQVSQPRMPCFKLGIRMGDAGFVQRFDDARRNGAYLRILHEGDVGAGDPIELVERPDSPVTIAFITDVYATHDPDGIQLLVDTPALAESWRTWAARQQARPHPIEGARD